MNQSSVSHTLECLDTTYTVDTAAAAEDCSCVHVDKSETTQQ